MNIRANDFVLEIGSGHNPKARSDVLCDKFIEDDEQRGGRIVADRPIVEADGQFLPFADQAFDYVICAHVLEHVEDPKRLIAELMRVARRGYIETPSEIGERIYGWHYHRWIVNLVDGRLTLQKNNQKPQFGQLFHTLAAEDKYWKRFHITHHNLFLVQYEWEGKIDYEILPDTEPTLDLECPATLQALIAPDGNNRGQNRWLPLLKNAVPRGIVSRVKSVLVRLANQNLLSKGVRLANQNLLSKGVRLANQNLLSKGVKSKSRQKKTLQEILVCPKCKGEIKWEEQRLHCEACKQHYPIINGIPRFTK